ncbi:MAG: choice-of-anchor J domain-containing protein, partial [Bacteroidales bacterium]|nr:choice-of-anchor J domain-containing protein [Bacteroidales bacterium]
QNAADDWLISPSFQFNGNQYGHFDYYCNSSNFHERFEVLAIGADTVLIVAPMVINNTTAQTLNLDLSDLSGEYSIAIHCISNPNQYNFYIENFNILNVTPSITVEQDSLEFTLIPLNGTSSSQAVVVSSIGVTTPLTATVPAPFEVSSDNLNFGHSATIPAVSDLFAHDTFYVRFAPTAVGLSENTLTITTGSLQETVVLSGTSRDCDEVLTLPVVEGFEGPDSYCWTSYDEDGDGFSWNNDYTNYTHSGSQSASSDSYISGTGALNPDNWLVSQPIQLPEIPARLSFWVKETYSGYTHEHYSVYVSTTGSAPADFTEVVFTDNATSTFEQHSVSLRNYAGQTVRIAFRHHASYDLLRFVLDDIDIRLDTVPQRPLVVTDSVFSITQMSAVCIGHTVFDGNSPVTASGFVWGTSPEPTVANNVVNATPGLPTMIGMLNGLSEHHTYYVRAFATNSIGTEYGEEIVFTTLCGPATYTSFNQSACESFTWNDSTYFESGNYTQNLTNMIGCDSIVTMHLTIHHGNTTAFSVTECESYTWNNITYEQSGDFTQSFTNIHGCDSTVTLHLTIHHDNTTAFSVTECDSYTWNGTEYQQSGDYNQTFANIHGCDSVVTLHLTLNYATSTEFADTACNVFVWNDSIYSETGDYVQHFETVHGCDSTVTLHLTIHNSDSTEFAATECESFVWNDTTYTQSGDYNQTFANIHGCDSVVTLHLTIHHGDSTEFAATECENYVWNDTIYTQSGDYTQTFANVHGCDSVVTLHLTVYPAVSSEETVAWPDSCYLWNGEEFCESGSYTQTLTTVHGCDSTVTLHLTITVGMEDFVMDNDLRVYPNPTNGLLNVSATAFTDVQLFDAYGKLVGRWHTNGEVTQIDLSQHATGIYFVKVLNQNQVVGVKKVLKQ